MYISFRICLLLSLCSYFSLNVEDCQVTFPFYSEASLPVFFVKIELCFEKLVRLSFGVALKTKI